MTARSRLMRMGIGVLLLGVFFGACLGGPATSMEKETSAITAGPELRAWVYNIPNPVMIALEWNDRIGAKAYVVERKTQGETGWEQLAVVEVDRGGYEDYTVQPATGYCYRVRPKPAKLGGWSNISCDLVPIVFQAEALARAQSPGTTRMIYGDEPGEGSSLELDLGANGWVEFTVPVTKTGVYDFYMNHEIGPYLGTWQIFEDGESTNQDDNFYEGWLGYQSSDLRRFEVTKVPATKTIRIQTTGKNAASSGYVIGVDTLVLRPLGLGRFEVESANKTVSKGDRMSVIAEAEASNGKLVSATLNAVGDFVSFDVPIALPGDYLVSTRWQAGPNAAKFKMYLGNTAIPDGEVDGYSEKAGLVSGDIGSLHIDAVGKYELKFEVTGKNTASSGFSIAVDYIDLRRAPSPACLGKPTGTLCPNNSNLCSLGNTCQHGTCVEESYKDCYSSIPACRNSGYCAPETGLCMPPTECDACGNGIVEFNEECDDGNQTDGDGCDTNCARSRPKCGDGFVQNNIASLSFTYLARNCNEPQGDIYFTVNGTEVARAKLPVTCDCEPGITTLEVTDPAKLAAITRGDNIYLVFVEGESAWVYMSIAQLDAGSTGIPFLPVGGSADLSSLNPNVCLAGVESWAVGAIGEPNLRAEACDDGNTVDDDECSNQCTLNQPQAAAFSPFKRH